MSVSFNTGTIDDWTAKLEEIEEIQMQILRGYFTRNYSNRNVIRYASKYNLNNGVTDSIEPRARHRTNSASGSIARVKPKDPSEGERRFVNSPISLNNV